MISALAVLALVAVPIVCVVYAALVLGARSETPIESRWMEGEE